MVSYQEMFDIIGERNNPVNDDEIALALRRTKLIYLLDLKLDSTFDKFDRRAIKQQILVLTNQMLKSFENPRNTRANTQNSLDSKDSFLESRNSLIPKLQEFLSFYQVRGWRSMEIKILQSLASQYIFLCQRIEAVKVLESLLKVLKELGKRGDEARCLMQLAKLHQKLGSIELARQECDRALAIAIELGIPLVKDCEILKQQLEEEHNASDR